MIPVNRLTAVILPPDLCQALLEVVEHTTIPVFEDDAERLEYAIWHCLGSYQLQAHGKTSATVNDHLWRPFVPASRIQSHSLED